MSAIEHAISANTIDRPVIVHAADGSDVLRSSLAGLIELGYPGVEEVIVALADLADVLTEILRTRHVPISAGRPLPPVD